MYKVYLVDSKACYYGISFVAANNAEEANSFIKDFQERDKKNVCDSWGYETVNEEDMVDGIWSEHNGIIHYGIRYGG